MSLHQSYWHCYNCLCHYNYCDFFSTTLTIINIIPTGAINITTTTTFTASVSGNDNGAFDNENKRKPGDNKEKQNKTNFKIIHIIKATTLAKRT